MNEYWGTMLLDPVEPPLLVCQRCREEFYQRSATEDTYCDECEAVVERQHEAGKEQPR